MKRRRYAATFRCCTCAMTFGAVAAVERHVDGVHHAARYEWRQP